MGAGERGVFDNCNWRIGTAEHALAERSVGHQLGDGRHVERLVGGGIGGGPNTPAPAKHDPDGKEQQERWPSHGSLIRSAIAPSWAWSCLRSCPCPPRQERELRQAQRRNP